MYDRSRESKCPRCVKRQVAHFQRGMVSPFKPDVSVKREGDQTLRSRLTSKDQIESEG
jgi:hypothetical protein